MKTNAQLRQYIYESEKEWFFKMQPFLGREVLKVGDGLGYLSSFIQETSSNLSILEVRTDRAADAGIVIYDGKTFPFKNKSFDCVVCAYVLHHTPLPMEIFDEIFRVSKRLILIEETYETIIAKFDLIYRDVYVNLFAGQPSKIYPRSYFKKGSLEKIVKTRGLKLTYHEAQKKRTYWKELFVIDS